MLKLLPLTAAECASSTSEPTSENQRKSKIPHPATGGQTAPIPGITRFSIPVHIWKAYIQLTQAEAAFRINKDQLRVRPIWHQRTDRVQAHILGCFLAFVLWKTLEMWQQRAGLGNSPRTVLEEFARMQSHDVVLPMQAQGEIRLRCVTQPDAAQSVLIERLGMVLCRSGCACPTSTGPLSSAPKSAASAAAPKM